MIVCLWVEDIVVHQRYRIHIDAHKMVIYDHCSYMTIF